MKRRTLLCVILALTMLFTAGCGGTSAGTASSGTAAGSTSSGASSSAASSSAASSGAVSSGESTSGEVDLTAIPEFQQPDYSLGLKANGYFDGVVASDYVTLPELTGIVMPDDVKTVADADLQAQIDSILDGYATDGKIYDRAVENGDQVNIDYVGRVDGVAFQGGSTGGAGTVVTAGGSEYIDDFLTQIIGAKPGDTVMVKVTFPDPYPNNADLAGKDAEFETVINYIQGERIVPELTDDWVKTTLADKGYTDVADMKAKLTDQLLQDQLQAYALEWLQSNSTFAEVPEKLIDIQNQQLMVDFSNSAYYYNMSLQQMLAYYGYTDLASLSADYRADFVSSTQGFLMCQAVAEKVGIEIDDEDIKAYFTDYIGNPEYSGFLSYYGAGYIGQDVLVYQVSRYLVENAVK